MLFAIAGFNLVERYIYRCSAAAQVVPVPETMGELEEEERYVQVASRFFRVKPRGGGANLHYLGSCFLCKESIACNRDVFMYKYAANLSGDSSLPSHSLVLIDLLPAGGTPPSAATTAGRSRWTWTRRSRPWRGATASCARRRRPRPRRQLMRRRQGRRRCAAARPSPISRRAIPPWPQAR